MPPVQPGTHQETKMATRRRSVGSGRSVSAEARKALRIEGIEEIQAKLANVINAATGKQAKDVYVEAAVYGKNQVVPLVPVKTGALRRAIFAARGDENKPDALLGVNYRIAPHAHLVEFGHGGPHPAGPHPYMRPGVTRAAPGIARIIKDGLLQVIDDAAEKK